MLPTVDFEGTLGADPELRFTPNGHAVCSIRVACNDRKKENGQWVDGETTWLSVNCWNTMATNLAESAQKGDRVVGSGRLVQRKYTTQDGQERTVFEVQAQTLGMALTFKAMDVKRVVPDMGSPGVLQGNDPWASPSQSEEIPF